MWLNFKGRGFSKTMARSAKRIAVVAALGLALAACKTDLYTGLDERQVNEMTAVLLTEGIEASRVQRDDTFALQIERQDMTNAVAVLSRAGLPRDNFTSLGDVFSTDKMVSTPFEERARFMYAMNQELAESITQIGGVTSARVHIMLPESSPLDRNPEAARASVFIYHDPVVEMTTHVPVIKKLIVNSISDLNYEDVSIALFPASTVSQSGTGNILPSLNSLVPANISLLLLLVPLVLLIIWVQLRRRSSDTEQKWLLK